jgi:hypothetical protein
MGSEVQATGPTTWTVTDTDSHDCPFVAIPMDSKRVLGDIHFKHENAVALFFTPPLASSEERTYKIAQQDTIFDSMKSLLLAKRDFLLLVNRKSAQFERVNLVLYIPNSFGTLGVAQYDGPTALKVTPGRTMTASELSALGTPPPDFRAVGWTASGVEPESMVAAWFIAS